MIFPLVVEDAVWYGPATVTFPVQFPGDPFDPVRNDIRVRFIGEKNQREERAAYFDPALGAWRATLFSTKAGSYRAILVRNGKDAVVEAEEGIVELQTKVNLGVLPVKGPRSDRFILDTGNAWIGIGADLGPNPTPERVEALANDGATWVRLVPPIDPLVDDDTAFAFSSTMDALERRGLSYTVVLPEVSTAAWRRYALARLGSSLHLVQWEAPADLQDPWSRAKASTAVPWDGLFENRPGPFVVKEGDVHRIKALRSVVETSGWVSWQTPRVWKGTGAKGVGESDRLILMASPGAKLTGIPLADGTYDLTTIDPATGSLTVGTTVVDSAALSLKIPGERFFVLRRKLQAVIPTPLKDRSGSELRPAFGP